MTTPDDSDELANALKPWKCETCGEMIEPQFDACWKCAPPVADADVDTGWRPLLAPFFSALALVVGVVAGVLVMVATTMLTSARDANERWLGLVLGVCAMVLVVFALLLDKQRRCGDE